ncbi:ABC transporter substrate-binding protein [Tatumella citrea]|uniref:ABC transporter substrate-binding protein n=1 Tax=Tatumella citrea TaxID=53336 RepID=A0A1Y0L948_TATCI|nr:ABC transporter substrate-binding protein [Tatumella citrea]ARU94467.1 ABC transporter substrate-binding protein [Tatumella citrea]ARU98506.1 ABC transporter substrate-binding protein [Tatumella citrea]
MPKTVNKIAMIVGSALISCSAFAQTKSLVVGGYPSYPPVDMRDPVSGKAMGFDIDFIQALEKQTGEKITLSETAFEQLIPSLKTGRLDFFLSAMSDTPERQKTITFVDYLQSGTQLMTLADGSHSSTSMSDYCGKRIAASRSTNILAQLRSWSESHCQAAGKPAMILTGAENNIDARMQLKQKRVDAMAQDSLTIPYIQQSEKGTYVTVGEPIDFSYMGIGVGKQNLVLQKKLQHALQAMIDDGSYAAMIKKWHLPANSAVPQAMINSQPGS